MNLFHALLESRGEGKHASLLNNSVEGEGRVAYATGMHFHLLSSASLEYPFSHDLFGERDF
jgi:hypothetical protein